MKMFLWFGAAIAAFVMASLLTPFIGSEWGLVVMAGTVFAFFAIITEMRPYALRVVVGYLVTLIGLNYFVLHRTEVFGMLVLAVTLVANVVVLWWRTRRMEHI